MLKSLLRRVKEENEKTGLKLNIQKMKIMASSPITSWQIDGEIVECLQDHGPSRGSSRGFIPCLFQLLMAVGIPGLAVAHSNLCLCT